MDYHQRITIDPLVRSGKPCVRGTRITVGDVLDYLGGGMTIPEVLDDFPDLKAEDVQACLSFCRRPRTPPSGPDCMKLLFDENLSPKLPRQVNDLFPGSATETVLLLS